jgi:hypothetical protein
LAAKVLSDDRLAEDWFPGVRVSLGGRVVVLARGILWLYESNDVPENAAMTIDAATQEEINRLNDAVDEFAAEMKARLREQAMKGYRGWDDPDQYERILQMMMQHAAVAEGEEVDAANLAMILWSLRRQR